MNDSKVVNSIGVSILIEIIEKLQVVNGVMAFTNLAGIVEKTFNIMGRIVRFMIQLIQL